MPHSINQRMKSHFETRFNRMTTKRRDSLSGRLLERKVLLQIATINSGEIKLTYMETAKQYRRQGFATDALTWLCELADECEMRLCLCPYEVEESMNVIQLTIWYQKFGFVRIGLQDEMMRYPHATR